MAIEDFYTRLESQIVPLTSNLLGTLINLGPGNLLYSPSPAAIEAWQTL
jgi:hypothetical protein